MESMDDLNVPEISATDDFVSTSLPATKQQRFVALLIDGILASLLTLVPLRIGWLLYVAYMLTRDALPFLEGQSIGKKMMKIRAVKGSEEAPLTNDWAASIIRNVSLVIPFVGLIEAIMYLVGDKTTRLSDELLKTDVRVIQQ
jgi:uncharacterized RDD family membrane protein YckC